MKNNKFKLIGMIILSGILMTSVFGFYINLGNFFQESGKYNGIGGFGLQRESDDFIVDGCGSGTMLDTLTGLCWDKDMGRGGTKQWATVTSYSTPQWNEVSKAYDYPNPRVKADYPAFEYCEDLVIDGNSDWRIPTNNEFMTLTDELNQGGTFARLATLGFLNCVEGRYWSSEEYLPSTTNAWFFRTDSDYDSWYKSKTTLYNIVCVSNP